MAEKLMTDGSMALREKQYRVITIEATEKPQNAKLRVAAYARVSSASDDQLNYFAAQNRHYSDLISSKENWRMVDIYADEGITGTSAEKREDFQRLLADCRRGLIDRVLVKSISRFARNTKECLETIRELKSLGVGVYFEKENIDTATMSGEMMTALFASFASKYALSERLVCGECGTLYRRCTWSKQGRKRVVWRCVSRLDYGTKYCHNSPTLDEEPLQKAILAAINSVMSQKSTLIRQITSAMEMELAPVPGESMSLADIERRLGELNDQTRELVAESARAEDATACTAQLRAIMNEAAVLKEKRALIEEQRQSNAQAVRRIEDAAAAMAQASTHISEWDEALIRQLVDTVKVNSAEKITVFLRGGIQVEQDMI